MLIADTELLNNVRTDEKGDVYFKVNTRALGIS